MISLTPVTDEPRVKRQASALHEAGWQVSVAGYRGRDPAPAFWRHLEVADAGAGPGIGSALWGSALSRFSEGATERVYWRAANYEEIYQQLAYVDPADYDLVLAHDWMATPLAHRLGEKLGIPFSVDVHEYARGQYMNSIRWRLGMRPWLHALQGRLLPRAAALTTVCDGIADLLFQDYPLPERPTVVRSFASHTELPFRPTGDRITALYHGILIPARGLEEAIKSAPRWNPGLHLVIRGAGPDDYVLRLRALAERVGASNRVTIEGPVPASEMIERANADADIGFFVQPDLSPQKRFTLPNKFFEYVTAGLALCVSDLPEMARFVNEHELGVLVPNAAPEEIARALNSMDRDSIDRFKRRSLQAARSLDWNLEKTVMLGLYERVASTAAR